LQKEKAGKICVVTRLGSASTTRVCTFDEAFHSQPRCPSSIQEFCSMMGLNEVDRGGWIVLTGLVASMLGLPLQHGIVSQHFFGLFGAICAVIYDCKLLPHSWKRVPS